jgi:hypothetical protein
MLILQKPKLTHPYNAKKGKYKLYFLKIAFSVCKEFYPQRKCNINACSLKHDRVDIT